MKSSGDNVEGARAGLAKLFELAATHKSCVIVVPNLGQLRGGLFTAALGDQLSETLIKHRKITLDNGNTIELCAQATLKNFRRANAYLALWGTKSIVEDIEAMQFWTSFVLVTWFHADAANWVQAHNVQVIYDDGNG